MKEMEARGMPEVNLMLKCSYRKEWEPKFD